VTTLVTNSHEIRAPIRIARRTLPRVACAVFACHRCSWPLVGAKFSRVTDDDFHDEVFELRCSECEWRGAMLGCESLDRMIVDWTDRKVMRLISAA
jgi:RNase P subunit RPR2